MPSPVHSPQPARAGTILLVLTAICSCDGATSGGPVAPSVTPGAGASPPPRPAHGATEREVIDNIIQQPVADGTLADLDLPAGFVARIADRITISTYRDRVHRVAPGGPRPTVPEGGSPPREEPPRKRFPLVRVSEDRSSWWKKLRAGRPGRRGFRVPERGEPVAREHLEPRGARELRRLVAERLARDGLLATTGAVLGRLPADADADPSRRVAVLSELGIPVDLLGAFAPWHSATALVSAAERAVRESSPEEWQCVAAAAVFEPEPAWPGARLVAEDGTARIGWLRLQLTRGTPWGGPGDGGSVDIARQLRTSVADLPLAIGIESRHLSDFVRTAARWPGAAEGIALFASDLPVAQWAQDNGKPMVLAVGSEVVTGTLLPRYASRREDGSVFVPGEDRVLEALAAAGHRTERSSLLFQGGDLLVVSDPRGPGRLLLLGEAEVHRNTALGLSRTQVLRAFRRECSVDRVLVLPSVSFHIDMDVAVRRLPDGRSLAFVNDVERAVDEVLEAGLSALRAAHVLDEMACERARAHLREERGRAFLTEVASPLWRRRRADGLFPAELAAAFRVRAGDSGVGNLRAFLAALDILASRTLPPEAWRATGHQPAMLRAERRLAARRGEFEALLQREGFVVVRVPGIPEGTVGLTSVNAIQDLERVLVPVHGGFYAELDRVALEVWRRAVGDEVEVIGICCQESQRRQGGLHCSAAVYPGPPPGVAASEGER